MKGYASLVKPYILWMSLFIVVPMLLIVLYAFTEHGNSLMAFRFTLDNFMRFFDPVFIKVLFKSTCAMEMENDSPRERITRINLQKVYIL